jgi:hypothetical protein
MSFKKLTLLTFIGLCLSSFRLHDNSKFHKLLDQAKMTFTLPEGFHEVRVIKNRQMSYDFAIQNAAADMEIRYTIRPIDTLQEKESHMDFDNELTNYSIFGAILFNISNQKLQMPELMKGIRKMPPAPVANELHGDDAMCSLVHLGREFGQDYKEAFVVALHKKATANAFIYIIGKDSTLIKRITPTLTHALLFQ